MPPLRKNTTGPAIAATAATGPAITSITPDTLAAGGPAATVEVYGSGFDSTCTVEADGQPRPTFYLDAGHLQYTARPDLQTAAQTVQITVRNGAGLESAAVPFEFTGPPPAPSIGFWVCECGVSISSSQPVPAPPTCVCGRAMNPVAGKVPKVLFDVVWVDHQDQRNR